MDDRLFYRMIRYWWVICLVGAVTFGCIFLEQLIGYRAVGFLYLLTVLITGFYNSLGPVLLGATLSAVAWNLFFIPPRFTFSISSPEDFALCLAYFIVATVTGVLTTRSRRLEVLAVEREERTEFLYEVVRDILELSKPQEFLQRISWRVEELLGGKCQIVLGEIESKTQGNIFKIKGRSSYLGSLIFLGPNELTLEQSALLESVAHQIGLSLERLNLEHLSQEAKRLAESERLHQTLLNSVSHELRTPLTALIGFASSLKEPAADTPEFRMALSEGLSEASERMNRVVGNLLSMSRLNSGVLSLHREWHDVNDLIGVVLQGLKNRLQRHSVKVRTIGSIPLVNIDFQLLENALSNLVFNSISYAPEKTEIIIEIEVRSNSLLISVSDEGPGLGEVSLKKVFEKFYRAPGTPTGGIGLGLSIALSIVELHLGTIRATNNAKGGALFVIELPITSPPPGPEVETYG